MWPIELKFGCIDKGSWHGKLRATQLSMGARMATRHIPMHILVGDQANDVVWMASFADHEAAVSAGEPTKMTPVDGRQAIVKVLRGVEHRMVTGVRWAKTQKS